MSITASGEAKSNNTEPVTDWKCNVCGYISQGGCPPDECPMCSGTGREFTAVTEEKRLQYDGGKFDVLLINGSNHRSNNTGYMIDLVEEVLRDRGITYRRYNLNEFHIDHCWCCYSMRDNACTYPCRNQIDDMAAFHEMIIATKAVIVGSPINWNNMSARLKDFLDRLNCIQNRYLLKRPGLTEGKIVGITVSGHEDGATKAAMDIYLYFQQMGYLLAPFGISYRTHGAQFNTNTDSEYLRNDPLVLFKVRGMASNVVEMLDCDLEEKLKGKLVPVCE
ncbi:MAG TPA: NAD(P)H-dependent oxidoreductase [Methanoregulaceae archaeon]|nr:NAD(P)H-dependent oxidoreductase [Methanoregulaceae archaeon]